MSDRSSVAPSSERRECSGPDFERQASLMAALDAWSARTCGGWVENGWFAVLTDRPFGEGRALAFECGCPGSHAHALDPSRDCTFVDAYARCDTLPDRMDRVIARLDRSRALDLYLGGVRALPRALGGVGRMLALPDGGHLVVQDRYVVGAASIARPEAWLAMPSRPWERKHIREPWPAVVVGRRDGLDVALIMPIRIDGARTSFPPPEARARRPARAAS
jgi:hypothetical protein